MDKRYQVFVSSTFADLKDERSKVIQTIMEMDCIPAGMELFPSIDEDQFNFIKKVIDDCDYYILIIGGRYGTLSVDGLSFTEREYDYAIEKGIKVIAFLHKNPDAIPFGKSEASEELRMKLNLFRDKVCLNRLVKFWENANELPGLVSLSLSRTIRTYPAIGWVRANMAGSVEILGELNQVRKENQKLKDEIRIFEKSYSASGKELASLDDSIEIAGSTYTDYATGKRQWKGAITWKDIFYILSPKLVAPVTDSKIKVYLAEAFCKRLHKGSTYGADIEEDHFQTIKVQFIGLNLIEVKPLATTDGGTALFWKLTEKGRSAMIEIRTIKKN